MAHSPFNTLSRLSTAKRQDLLFHSLPALERGARVTDVALDCGYESLSAFIAAFRKLFDASPGEFFGARRDPT